MNTKVQITFLTSACWIMAATTLAQPTITMQPGNQTASPFADATFGLMVSGDVPLSYQWRFNDADLIGMTNPTLTVTNVQRANAGNYAAAVTNPSGSVTSQVATLTITTFNSIHWLGDSWTDTRGIRPDGTRCGFNPPDYYGSRACNGPMWPEFISTNLGVAYVPTNNYGRCGATSSDVLNQLSSSFRMPSKSALSLYFLWAGDADFLPALPPDGFGGVYIASTNEVAWNQLIQKTIVNNSNAIDQLYLKGARQIVVQSLWDLSKSPESIRDFGTNTAGLSRLSESIARCNAGLSDTINIYSQTRTDLRIVSVDIFSNLNEVLENPAQYGFTKTTVEAINDPALGNKSFAGPGANYVFWDPLHGTSKLHKLMTAWNLERLTNSVLEKLETIIIRDSPNIRMNHLLIGRDYLLQESTDLKNWRDTEAFTATAGSNQWLGPVANVSALYFRLKWQQ